MGGYLRNGLEVSDPLTASALYTHSNGNWIKGMVVVEQNDLELVLLGLITGEVYKVCLFVCLFVCFGDLGIYEFNRGHHPQIGLV